MKLLLSFRRACYQKATPSSAHSFLIPIPRQMSSAHSPNSFRFDIDSTVTKISDSHFRCLVTDNWSISDSPNGGYMMSIAISAARECIKYRDPLSMTAYYLAKSLENTETDIHVEILGNSNSTSTVQVSISQLGVIRSRYLAVFGDFQKMKGLNYTNLKAPEIPLIDDCIDASAILRNAMGNNLKILNELEIRVSKDSNLAKGILQRKQ